jgi:hypothetical protein
MRTIALVVLLLMFRKLPIRRGIFAPPDMGSYERGF